MVRKWSSLNLCKWRAKKFFSIEKSYRMIVCKCNIVVVFLNRLCLVVVEIFYNTSPGLISFYTISTESTAVLNQQLI